MNTNFAKYCSLCTHENLAIASFCEKCDADLMNTPVEMRRNEVTDVDLCSRVEMQVVHSGEMTDELQNSQVGMKAQSEVVTQRVKAGQNSSIELVLVVNPSIRFMIRAGQTVGRAAKADVIVSGVPDLEYISRVHVRFIQRRAQWYVQYIAEGNSITVDGVESRDDAEIAIYDQSVVVLSFTAFTVRLA